MTGQKRGAQFNQSAHGKRPGRPPRAVEEAAQRLVAEVFNDAAARRVLVAQIKIASDPDNRRAVDAAKFLFDRRFGPVRPSEEEAPSGIVIRVSYEPPPSSEDA